MITYATARPDELTELAEFWRRTSRWHESWPTAPPVDALVRKFQPASGTAATVVARDGRGAVVGVATLRVADNGLAAGPGSLFGSNLLVHPHHRGGAVAGGLMDQVFARAVALGATGIIALVDPTNEVAERLYRYYGFRDGTPASAECCYVELVSRWPQVARYLVEAVGPHLPAWPDPSLSGLRRGFRPRGRPTETPGGAAEVDVYRAEVPAWHRPAVEVHVHRATGAVVGLDGSLVRVTVTSSDAGRAVEVRNTAPVPLGLAVAGTVDDVSPAVVAPGDVLVASVAPDEPAVVEVHRPEGGLLARFPFPVTGDAAGPPSPVDVCGGPLRARVSATDGVVEVAGPDGRALVDLQWPEAGDVAPLVARRGLAGDVEVRRLPDGAVVASAPLDRWWRALGTAGLRGAGSVGHPARVHRIVRPLPDGISIEVDIEVPEGVAPPEGPLHLGWWWRLQEGVACVSADTTGHQWVFAPHGLPEPVAGALLPAATQPPAEGAAPTGELRWRAHDLELDLSWSTTGADASWTQRTLPALAVDLGCLHGRPPGRHRVATSVLRARAVDRPAGSPRRAPVAAAPVDLDIGEAGVVTVTGHDGHRWVPAWDPELPIRPTRRTPAGIVPVVARGPWRWSVEGGLDPEEWEVDAVGPERWQWRRSDRAGAEAGLRAEVAVARTGQGWEVRVRAEGEPDESGLLTVGVAAVVQPPGPATVRVETPAGPVCVDAATSSGHLRLLGRGAVAVHQGATGIELNGGPDAAVAAWPVDGPHRVARCPVLVTRRVAPGEVVVVVVGGVR